MAKSSLKSTLAVSLNNYLDAGAIVAGASGITLWQNYLGLSEMHLGWLNAISANALGAAIGAIIGGFLADRFGRKFIFTYNLLVYMTGVLIIMLSVNFPMLLAGFLVTGISVGIGVPASWTYISESSEVHNRGRNICISQMSWGFGPMIILLFGMLFAPGGYLYNIVESVAHAVIGTDAATSAVEVFSSRVVFFTLFVVAFFAWTLQRQLEESAEWRPSNDNLSQAGGSPSITGGVPEGRGGSSIVENIKSLFTNKIAVKTALYLAAIYLTWNLVASVMGFFLPHIYETAGGVTNEQANWLSCVLWFCTVATTAVLALFIDRTSHKFVYVLGLLVAITPWVMVVTTGIGSTASLWAFAILWGIEGGLSVQIFYALWGSELFPAKFRAGAQGLMFFLVRGLSAVWGLVFTFIYGDNGEGFTLAAYCMIVLLVLSLVIGVAGCPNTRGKSLAQITKERYGEEI
jgi:inositol transporter-like SP family MFS transporter